MMFMVDSLGMNGELKSTSWLMYFWDSNSLMIAILKPLNPSNPSFWHSLMIVALEENDFWDSSRMVMSLNESRWSRI